MFPFATCVHSFNMHVLPPQTQKPVNFPSSNQLQEPVQLRFCPDNFTPETDHIPSKNRRSRSNLSTTPWKPIQPLPKAVATGSNSSSGRCLLRPVASVKLETCPIPPKNRSTGQIPTGPNPLPFCTSLQISFYLALEAMSKRADMHPPSSLETSLRISAPTQSNKHNTSRQTKQYIPQSQEWPRRATRSIYNYYVQRERDTSKSLSAMYSMVKPTVAIATQGKCAD